MTTPQFASSFAPSAQSWLGIAREAYTGTPVLPTALMLVEDPYEPEDTPVFLTDKGVRATMGGIFGAVLGPEDATFSFGGPIYLRSAGYWFDNTFGDLSTVSSGVFGTAQSLQNPLNIGDTSLNTLASLGAVTTNSTLQITDGAASEILVVSAAASGTAVTFTTTPCRFPHENPATVALQTSQVNYAHSFNVLNNGTGEPPTHTLTDWTGLTPNVGARCYPSAVVAQIDITGDSMGLVTVKVSGASWLSAPAASQPSPPGSSFNPPPASWLSTITIGGSPVLDVGEWTVSLTRQIVVYWGAGNPQTPYILARGPLTVSGSLDYTVPSDETPLSYLTSGAQPSLLITVGNPAANIGAMTISCAQIQVTTAKPVRGETLIGYADTWIAIDNATNTGGSGGLGPCTVTLTNIQRTY